METRCTDPNPQLPNWPFHETRSSESWFCSIRWESRLPASTPPHRSGSAPPFLTPSNRTAQYKASGIGNLWGVGEKFVSCQLVKNLNWKTDFPVEGVWNESRSAPNWISLTIFSSNLWWNWGSGWGRFEYSPQSTAQNQSLINSKTKNQICSL